MRPVVLVATCVLLGALAWLLPGSAQAAAVDAGEVQVGFSNDAIHYHGRAATGGPPACNNPTPTFLMLADAAGAPPACEMLYGGANFWGLSYDDPELGPVSAPCRAYAEPVAAGPCDAWNGPVLQWQPVAGPTGFVVTGPVEAASSVLVRSQLRNSARTIQGSLLVEHEMVASPDPRMVEVEIRVVNPLDVPIEDVHYRRMFGHRGLPAGPPAQSDPTESWQPEGTRSAIHLGGDRPSPPDTVECTTNNPWTGAAPQPGDCLLQWTIADATIARQNKHCRDTGELRGPVVPGPGTLTGPGQAWSDFPQGVVECGSGFLWQFDLGTLAPRETRVFRYYLGAALNGLPEARALLDAMPDVEFWGIATPVDVPDTVARSLVVGWAGLSPPAPALSVDVPVPPWAGRIPSPFVAGSTLCAGSAATFHSTIAVGTYPLRLTRWDLGDGTTSPGPAGPSTVTHQYDEPGTYTVRLVAEDEGGWAREASLTLQVVACDVPPLAAITSITSAGTCTDTLVHFAAAATDPDGGGSFTFRWDFGDGTTAQGPLATHQYDEDAGRMVRLTVLDDDALPGIAVAERFWLARADFNCLPELDVPVTILTAVAGSTFRVDALARDLDDIPDVLLSAAPGGQLQTSASAAGTAARFEWATQASTKAGLYLVRLTATDGKADAARTVDLVLRVLPRPAPDADGDGVADFADNCAAILNGAQDNADGDRLGNACDLVDDAFAANPAPRTVPDRDRDGLADPSDNCVDVPNPDQLDLDGDGDGDACDPDRDGDSVPEGAGNDNCPALANADQADLDQDATGDACDPASVAMASATAAVPWSPGPRPRLGASQPSAPWFLMAGVGALALAVVAWRGWRGLWVVSFSRLRRPDLLRHPVRNAIAQLLEGEPGLHAQEIVRRLGKGRGTVAHHLAVLQAAGLVEARQSGNKVRFSIPGQQVETGTLGERLADAVRQAPGQSVSELCAALSATHGAVTYHLRRLEACGGLRLEREGTRVLAFPVG